MLTRSTVDDAIARGPGWVLSKLQLDPVMSAGRRFLGFRLVRFGDDEGRDEALGVRVGDIIHAVNGIRLLRPEDMLRIGERLRREEVLTMVLQRGDQRVVVDIPIVTP